MNRKVVTALTLALLLGLCFTGPAFSGVAGSSAPSLQGFEVIVAPVQGGVSVELKLGEARKDVTVVLLKGKEIVKTLYRGPLSAGYYRVETSVASGYYVVKATTEKDTPYLQGVMPLL